MTEPKQRRYVKGERDIFSIRLRPPLKETLQEEAYARDLSLNELISRILAAWVKTQQDQRR